MRGLIKMKEKVRTLFDPPTGGTLSKAYEAAVNELEWRIIVESTK